MKMKMICSVMGYPDGFTRTPYTENKVYEIPQSLAECFLAGNVAKEWIESEEEEKDLGNAPENKAFTQAPDNKKEQSDKPSNGSKKVRKREKAS